MKKTVVFFLTVLICSNLVFAQGTKESSSPKAGEKPFAGEELVVATWGWNAANVKKLSADFEDKYGCEIIIDETAGNSDRLNKIMAQKNNPEIDVAFLTDSFAIIGNEKGVFEKIDTSVVTNLDNLYDFAINKDGYGPSFSLVRYGLIYNKDLVEKPESYLDLFTDEYKGLVALPDVVSSAGPYLLISLAEELGGSQENIQPALDYIAEYKDNIAYWYNTSSEVQTGFTTGEIAVALFMDINLPLLAKSGINVGWTDAKEGSFSAAATVNVVKDCLNPELAQLYVDYLISDAVQDNISDILNEAPTNKNVTISAEKAVFLAGSSEAITSLREFDFDYINANKADWINKFQRIIAK
jgi:putative spermidine/putrescine transport system substrate-binding protein